MDNGKPPDTPELFYMPVYVDRLLASTCWNMFNATQRGVYCALLYHQWKDGVVPRHKERVKAITGCSRWDTIQYVLDTAFTKVANGWINEVTEEVRSDQRAKVMARKQRGRKAANVRWHGDG